MDNAKTVLNRKLFEHFLLFFLFDSCLAKGPSTHGEEFANEYSTNIRRRIFLHFFNIKFAKANQAKSKNLTKNGVSQKN